ncbi:flavodoxin family protein [Qipengyuania sp.]|uniref:flavodoxin family protein n=1 Tax=Qipengyuania sp. TaxID=2004515 RepID=UPI0035C7BFAE
MASPLLILWHSRTGASGAMAQAAADGAGERACLLSCEEATENQFLSAKGYLFCCPENLAAMSGAMKEMFDRLYYPLLGRIEGRAYATIIAAGSDGTGAQAQLDRIAKGWRLKRVAEPQLINFSAQTPEAILAQKTVPEGVLATCKELGESLAEGLAQGIF